MSIISVIVAVDAKIILHHSFGTGVSLVLLGII